MLWVLVLSVTAAVCLLTAVIRTVNRRQPGLLTAAIYLISLVLVCCVFLQLLQLGLLTLPQQGSPETSAATTEATTLPTTVPTETTAPPTEPTTVATEPPTEPTTIVTEPPQPELNITEISDSADPANWKVTSEVQVDGKKVSEYLRENPISFGKGEDYFALPGVSTFRGDNMRHNAAYGTVNVTKGELKTLWTAKTGSLLKSGGNAYWTGNGWTGQPLMVQWDEATKQLMNLYDSKKNKEGLVEVIYASMDGQVHFYDLEDGSPTRDPINVGMCFKGAGSLDPRGYPLLYVGSGDSTSSGKKPRMFVISLIDGKILYEQGYSDSFAPRSWRAFDSAPLIHADTDTLIWPGENGVIYTIRLNTQYDPDAGTVAIEPDAPVKFRYDTKRSSGTKYWYGFEPSAAIVNNYLYISENGGMFFCIDLNTMTVVWAQDTKDDSNSTPAFQWLSNEESYVYTAPSLHWTKNSDSQGYISIYKLNALTGEIVWEVPYFVNTVTDISGGVQASPVLGKEGTDMEGLVIYSVSRIPTTSKGILVALSTETGEEVWRLQLSSYSWSSPIAVYEEDGTGYIVHCDFDGNIHLIRGATGEVVDTLDSGGKFEASPAAFGNILVVGSRYQTIYAIEIT